MQSPEQDAWLSPSRAAKLLPGVSVRTLQKWCKDGYVPGATHLPNNRWLIPREGIIKLLEQGTPNPLDPEGE
ncbi:helix-turn-helix domain-containing protein [Corynebacterium uropygiale]|uniref:helix-turn-helix domain-containing protein n=1 Tax=Corynebacterium uropygiale TaxID=1775911 RepID=UPI003B8310BE